jgi:hypothetical protein
MVFLHQNTFPFKLFLSINLLVKRFLVLIHTHRTDPQSKK